MVAIACFFVGMDLFGVESYVKEQQKNWEELQKIEEFETLKKDLEQTEKALHDNNKAVDEIDRSIVSKIKDVQTGLKPFFGEKAVQVGSLDDVDRIFLYIQPQYQANDVMLKDLKREDVPEKEKSEIIKKIIHAYVDKDKTKGMTAEKKADYINKMPKSEKDRIINELTREVNRMGPLVDMLASNLEDMVNLREKKNNILSESEGIEKRLEMLKKDFKEIEAKFTGKNDKHDEDIPSFDELAKKFEALRKKLEDPNDSSKNSGQVDPDENKKDNQLDTQQKINNNNPPIPPNIPQNTGYSFRQKALGGVGLALAGALIIGAAYKGLKWGQKKYIERVLMRHGLSIKDLSPEQQNLLAAALHARFGHKKPLKKLLAGSKNRSALLDFSASSAILNEIYSGDFNALIAPIAGGIS